MLKLPVCPYCHTVYGYKDVLLNKNKKSTCYHCKRKFTQSRLKGYLCLILIAVFISVIINIFIINLVANIISALVPMFIVSIGVVIIGFLVSPFFVSYRKIKGEAEKYIETKTIESTEIKNIKVKKSVKHKLRKDNHN